jgi:hypothetical protein
LVNDGQKISEEKENVDNVDTFPVNVSLLIPKAYFAVSNVDRA